MNGPQHYEKADDALELARECDIPDERAFFLAEAQIHATLALVAITAPREVMTGRRYEAILEDWEAVLE